MPFFRRVLNLSNREKLDREIEEELQSHIEMRTESNIAAGMSPEDARRDAHVRFGNRTAMRERVANVDAAFDLTSFLTDLRYALRRLWKAPGFAITVILTLALGIGANTAVFSIVDAVLLRPLPYKNADRLVVVWQTDAAHRGTGAWFNPYRDFEEWQHGTRSFERLAAMTWATGGKTLLWHGKPSSVLALPASTDFFAMLGAEPALGRTFNANDLNNGCTLVLAYSYWQQQLGAPRDIVGQSVPVDHVPCTIVGVMAKDFAFYPKETNAWSLITPTSAFAQKPWASMTGVFGLLRPGVSYSQAEAELGAIEKRVSPEAPASMSQLASAIPVVLKLQDNFTWLTGRNLKTGLLVLLGAIILVLLMACLNVANLVLGRMIEQRREMAIRTALGSGRTRLIRQMLMESLTLALAGSLVGVGLAVAILRWFASVNPVELPPGSTVTLDWRVLLFAASLGVGSVLIFGLVPALRASRADLNALLKSGERGSGIGASGQRASQALVVMQIGLSLMLIIGAALLSTSLWKMSSTRLGYRTDQLLTSTVNLPKARYGDNDSKLRFSDSLVAGIQGLPGVQSVALASSFTPMGDNPLSVQGDASKYTVGGIATQSVSVDFLRTMQIALFRGRAFDSRDRSNTQQVAIVNQALADKYFPHADPIGHAIKLSRAEDATMPWLTVIGVVANVKTTNVFQEMEYVEVPTVYRPLTQDPPGSLAVVVATQAAPLQLVEGMQAQLASIDRDLVLGDLGTMKARQAAVLAQPRFRTVLFGSFAGLALLLAVVGLYGVLAQMVVRRTREIAIRMAVGATREAVLRGILLNALTLAALGIGVGLVASVVTVRALQGLLYGIHAENPAIFALASVVLALTALIASFTPAWRAANVNPMQALRTE